MKIILKKSERFKITSSPRKILLFSYLVILASFLLIFLQMYYFLEENFYKKVTQSEQILILRGMVITSYLDEEQVSETIKKIEDKKTGFCETGNMKNLFTY